MKDLFETNCIDLARNLLWCRIIYNNIVWIITETEAYLWDGTDAASHSHKGITARNYSMFLPSWHIYVYQIYGMYYCLNFVSGPEWLGEAVLIRWVNIVNGMNKALVNYWPLPSDISKIWKWPWKVCKLFSIDKKLDGICLFQNDIGFRLEKDNKTEKEIIVVPRVGITKALDKMRNFQLVG